MCRRIALFLITVCCLLFAFMFLTVNQVFADTCYQWFGGTWNLGFNWYCTPAPNAPGVNRIPNTDDEAFANAINSYIDSVTVVRNAPTTTQPGPGVFTIMNSGTLINNNLFVNNGAAAISSGGTLINYGTLQLNMPMDNQGTLINCGTIIGTVTGNAVLDKPCNSSTKDCFNDGRLNGCDPGQTVAVYCEKDGSVTVYAIYGSKGHFAFRASPKEIAKVPLNPATNTLIKERLGARLYRLTSGELQVNRAEDGDPGKEYHFIFNDCPKPG